MNEVYIMRGIPGSGKDWWIKWALPPYSRIISADLKRMVSGVYVYDKTKDSAIHSECLREYTELLQAKNERILVVNNTNIRSYEFTPYYKLAEAYGWDVQLIWIIRDLGKCIAQNTHQVPEATIRSMMATFDSIPPWWNQRLYLNS